MQSVHSCPIGRMLDPKAGFTILLPPIKSPPHRHSLARFHLAGCFFIWTILFTNRLHRVSDLMQHSQGCNDALTQISQFNIDMTILQ